MTEGIVSTMTPEEAAALEREAFGGYASSADVYRHTPGAASATPKKRTRVLITYDEFRALKAEKVPMDDFVIKVSTEGYSMAVPATEVMKYVGRGWTTE